ncbi:Ninein [Chelonia mydas]|uniref:Ninein n=1 Tax=Chelonia mydas TaxID=8469 RepID=M7BPD9_CHEMY|nr:Ninein [Chelonia mydas]
MQQCCSRVGPGISARLDGDQSTTPRTPVDTSEDPEEDEYGGHVNVGSSCALSQDLVLSSLQSSQSLQLSTGKSKAGEEPQVSAVGDGMDEAEQDQYEARLKELFDSFDTTGTGSLGQEELTDLCHVLHLEEVAPGALQQTLLQGNLLGRVHFDQFKEALILILSRTLSNEDDFQEPVDSSPEAQPKYVKGGKRYGRRSLPEFRESVEEFAEVTVIEPHNEAARSSHIASNDCDEHWKTQDSEEYEAEGQLRFWNPDDLNASQTASSPPQDWIEEKLQEVCENLGITRDGHLNRKKLISVCEQYGLHTVDGEVLEDVFHNLEQDGTMSIEDFFYGLFKNGKSLTPSASTPYRQLKRHLSMQSFDESGRRTTALSAMTSTIGFRVFSSLDDGMGYASVERVLDTWHEEGIENGHEILTALDFSLDGKVNLTELTLALENELLITKNGTHQAALASFKMEIRHLLERVDQVVREKEKLRSDLEKAEKLKSLMASEVDDHHATIERRNEYNLRKLDEEYKERTAALKNELRKEREQILQQAAKQRLELEREIEKVKTEENYVRDRLTLSLKENSRLESELLETGQKLSEYESLTSKLQRNLENVLAEKFGDLDPSSAEFFLQEERLVQMKNEYEQQCRELQDQIDELQSELEEYRTQGRIFRPSLESSLHEEFDIKNGGSGGVEPDQGLGSEDCNPLNMSIEAEMVIERMKEQHHKELQHLKQELKDTMSNYEKLVETKTHCEKEQENMVKKYNEERQTMEKQISALRNQIEALQGETAMLKEEQERIDCKHNEERNDLQMSFDKEKANLQELLKLGHEEELQVRLEQVQESFNREREALVQNGIWMEEKMRALVQTLQEEKGEVERGFHEQLKSLTEKHAVEREELQHKLLEKHQQELQEERKKMDTEYNRRTSQTETQFSVDRQTIVNKYEEALRNLEERYQRELQELAEQQHEEKSQWEFEKDEIIQECAEAQEQLKEMLESKKAISFVLTQEKELLEKNFKELVNKLMCEKEQLQKELQDLRNVAEKQEDKLQNKILQQQNDYERELKDREEQMSVVEEKRKLVSQRLEVLETAYEQEKYKLNSKLLALEGLNKETHERAEKEKAQMSLEILKLQETIKKLQQETLDFAKLRNDYNALANEYAEVKSKVSALSGLQQLEEDGEVLTNLQKVHEQAVKENVKMVSEIVRLQQRLQRLEQESGKLSSFDQSNSEMEESQVQDRTEQIEGNVLKNLQDGSKETDHGANLLVLSLLEAKTKELEEMVEAYSSLKKMYEDTKVENHALKIQIGQLLESIMVLEAEYNEANDKKQDQASKVSVLEMRQTELEKIFEVVPKLKMFYEDVKREKECSQEDSKVAKITSDHATARKELCSEVSRLQTELKKAEEITEASLQLEKVYGASKENGEQNGLVPQLWEKIEELEERSRAQSTLLSLQEEIQQENKGLKSEMIKLFEQNKKLEENVPRLTSLQLRLEESNQESVKLKEEKTQLLEKVKELEDARDQYAQEKIEMHSENLRLQHRLGKLEEHTLRQKIESIRKEKVAVQKMVDNLRKQCRRDKSIPDGSAVNSGTPPRREAEAESTGEQRLSIPHHEDAKQHSVDGRASLIDLTTVSEGDGEALPSAQVSDLKAKNQQLDFENAELSQKNSKNQADMQDLNQRLARILRQKEKEVGKCTLEEWERERSKLKEELENCQVKSSTLVSSLETELSKIKVQTRLLEQENHLLKQELEKTKQLPRCPDLSDFQNEISSVITKNEKLLKEKEALSEELNRCVDKVAKVNFLENVLASLKQEQKSWEQQSQTLKMQLTVSQEKVQSLDEALQNINLQLSRLKSDLRVTQQEKEALKQEVMSLHKQLQNANDKNRVLEVAVHSSGLQNQQKKLHWDELEQLIKQEQQLLRQENERLQREVQNTKTDLTHSREKIRQLESAILSMKHQKHQSQSGIVKAIEQEKLSLKRECEQLQKELSSAHRRISQMNSLEHELETINLENEGLRKKQVKLDEQLMEMLHSSSNVMLSQSQHSRELQQLQQQGCTMVPKEQFLQLQHQLQQAERRSQRLQEELENRPSETNMPQGGHAQLLKMMEERMMDVEQKLKLVKRLLQDKVNQLKEQLSKNTKADAMVKDLYVENAQLLKALEMTEQRQKTAEKKNYFLEEKIANLSKIVKNLASPSLNSTSQLSVPRYDQPPPVTYQPQQAERSQPLLVPANPYHTAEIPDWLQVYARAPVKYDHILKWELFQLADLDTYQGMLKLLFMKELERIVKLYEAYRQALLTELENRKLRQQWYAQQHGKNF